ncbi:hypothetical protein I6G56_25675 [Burkholderia humptydooensis]|uniref:Uncharacterized protein n=2 Tax=Burkholderia humptydooensis TaxID=430531 RepID=A0A7U4PB40_9BURK|nr:MULTISPECIES: hypothetical protein [Burkholderia]AJY38987.1 regulator of chromosome condensation (RCC1) repeat family protein [Burkholderia sp. 2002721687]ALX46271.1 hypothetical protein AQ610_28275 [Burkholderia humptydooensis]EIP84389.1 hypothetical protein A33K_18956 [Burkholderia humptydooensis MSMB43]QPS47779.1 hypothetical protein I6G56_25675 [Burkholderia humptydooensis]
MKTLYMESGTVGLEHAAEQVHALIPLYIPDAVPVPYDDPASLLYAVGISAINDGLKVFVEAYDAMAIGDLVEVHWDDTGVPFDSVEVTNDNLNQRLGLNLREERFRDGRFEPFYRIRRVSDLDTDSDPRDIWVKLERPGGYDPIPSTPRHENLAAPGVPDDVAQDGVDADRAKLGVDVTIDPYENMAEYDRIDFSWGGQRQVHLVRLSEVGQAVVIHVSEGEILAAGDGPIVLEYWLIDAAANTTDKSHWSLETVVEVVAGNAPLLAPVVKEADENGELDLAGLAGQDATVQVAALGSDFVVGDTIMLTWAGRTANGASVEHTASREVTAQKIEEFLIPYAKVAAIAQGSARVSYVLRKGSGGGELRSKRTTVTVVGEVVPLPAPAVREAQDGQLDADVVEATVDIEPYLGMAAGDVVTLVWAGTKADGTPTDYRDTFPVSGGAVGRPVEFRVPGPTQIAVLAGGQVEVYYLVSNASGAQAVLLARESARLPLTVVGKPVMLPEPSVDEASGGVLDPEPLPAAGATVRVKPYDGMHDGDYVTVRFAPGSGAGEHIQSFDVTQNMVGKDIVMRVPKAKVQFHLGSQVIVNYTVERYDNTTQNSENLTLNVRTVAKWPAPGVDEAQGDYLDPELARLGATTRVFSYSQMQSGDRIVMHWGNPGDVGFYTDSITITTVRNYTFLLTPADVAPWIGRTVPIWYRIERGVQQYPSEIFSLRIGAAELPMLEAASVVEAVNGILDPSKLTTKATARIPVYDGMASGDYIHLTWGGGPGSGGLEWFIDVTGNMVGRPILRDIPLANITPFEGRNVELVYTVDTGQPPVRESEVYSVRVQRESLQLAAPRVPAVNNGVLDPRDVAQGAEVLVDRQTGMQQGDTIRLHWDCTIPAGSYTSDELVGSSQNPVSFTVPAANVHAGVNGGVDAWYELLRGGTLIGTGDALEFAIRQSDLPLPVITQANGQTLDPDDVPAGGATVMLAASALFKRNDQILLTWAGAPGGGSGTYPHTVSAAEEGGIVNITVPKSVVEANNGGTVTLTYSVTRAAGGPPEYSGHNIYDVRRELGSGDLLVMGARYNGSIYRASGAAQYLRALNRTTRADLLAEWRYEDEPTWTTGVSFKDTRPWVALRVRSQTHQITINAANIVGSGADSVGTTGVAAVVALLARKNVIGWGVPAYGGDVPPTIITYTDVEEVSSTQSAFAVRRTNGRVAVWGNTAQGGAIPDGGGSIVDAVRIQGNGSAFVAVRGNGYLTAWGTAAAGGTLSTEAQGLADVAFVATSGTAFCALRRNRQVVAWGTAASGGNVPDAIKALTDISDVRGNYTAFVALRANSTVVAWGTAADGGTVPGVIAARTDIIELASSSARAFAVRTQGGQVLAWGNANHGGTVPADIAALTDIEEVTATWGAFCARRGNGSVVAWGDTTRGGTVPGNIAVLTDIVQVVGTGAAFAALRRNGTVVTWGLAAAGGDSSSVVGQLVNIHAVYSNSQAFVALKAAGGAVTWGIAASGGDSSSVRTILDANLFYQATAGGLSYSSEKGRAILAMAG